jgi:hypothetical protein
MGKLIVFAVLVAGGFAIYWTQFHQSPAYRTYLQWVKATNEGDCGTLNSLAEGKAKDWADGFCGAVGGMTVFGQSIPGRSAAQMVAELKNTPQGAMQVIKHALQSEASTADGQVSLVVIESVAGRPSNFNHPAPDHRHEVTLKQSGDLWKVTEFKDQEQP